MWTYLAIFLGGFTVVLVFIRRVTLSLRKEENLYLDRENEIEQELINSEIEENKKKGLSGQERDKVSYFYEMAERTLKSGDEDESIKLFIQALAINPLHVESLHKLAVLYMNRQMYSQASALIKQLVSITDDPVHYSNLGLAFYNMMQYEDAKKAYQTAVLKDETRPQRFVSLSQVYRSLGNLPLAIIALNKAVALEEFNVDFRLLLADMYMDLNRFQDAKNSIDRVLDFEPGNEDAKALLKELREKMDSFKK